MNTLCLGKLFGWIDKRCRQATGKTDEVFGGISIILVGDPGQLPPVADKPLYHSKLLSAIVFNEPFNKLMKICHINPSITTDVEILENLLELEMVKLSYDTQNNKLINIEVIHI